MKFTDKVLEPIATQVSETTERIENNLEELRYQVAAVAGFAMVAFLLVSVVAVTALVKASK